MAKLSFKFTLTLAASFTLLASANTTRAFAQDFDTTVQDEIVTIGTRRKARSAADTPAPVDVISGVELTNQAASDALDILRTSVPAFNVNTQPISDGATIIRPANLRGLSPDHTLVLLNGKRRHRGSVITFFGGGIADGAQGVDLAVFPALALKQVEVLRDGASSQYGSDAIAGVINFSLKDSPEDGTVEIKYGSTYVGDGDTTVIAANKGFALGSSGFLNATIEYSETDGTIRAKDRTDVITLINAGVLSGNENELINTYTDQYAQYWGQPDITDNIKIFLNSALTLGENTEIYAFGNFAERTTEGGFFFRNPNNRGGVYRGPRVNPFTGNSLSNVVNDNGTPMDDSDDFDEFFDSVTNEFVAAPSGSVLVGALNGDTAACPAGIPLINGAPDSTSSAYDTVFTDGNCFSFIETIPTGFTPRFGGDNSDKSITAGLRGEISFGDGIAYDLSITHGQNQTDFTIRNTINASLGPASPRDFNPGSYQQTETVLNADFNYDLDFSGVDVGFAFGGEYREETFDIIAGDSASYALGPLVFQGFASGSNGFSGFANDIFATQDSYALYGELESDVTDALTLQASLRYEDYSAFGDTLDFKIASLYKFGDDLTVRGTYSTGFHAPSAGQANVTDVGTRFINGSFIDRGTLPLSSSAGQLGANFIESQFGQRPELGTEESKNISFGVVFDTGGVSWTVDSFQIDVDNRIAVSADVDFLSALQYHGAQNGIAIADGTTVNSALTLLGSTINRSDFVGFENLAEFRYFTNSFDTRTRGIDVIGHMSLDLGVGDTEVILAANYTDTDVTSIGTINPINGARLRALEDLLPNVKGFATLTHSHDRVRGFVRANYHGSWYDTGNDFNVGSEILIDAEVGFEIVTGLELIAGAANLLDNYPDLNDQGQFSSGDKYPEASPFGFAGGQYYVKARYTF